MAPFVSRRRRSMIAESWRFLYSSCCTPTMHSQSLTVKPWFYCPISYPTYTTLPVAVLFFYFPAATGRPAIIFQSSSSESPRFGKGRCAQARFLASTSGHWSLDNSRPTCGILTHKFRPLCCHLGTLSWISLPCLLVHIISSKPYDTHHLYLRGVLSKAKLLPLLQGAL